MNSNVHPAVVALVLALTAIAIATWMWGSGAAANVGGPSELKLGPDGHVYVQIQNKLVEHDENGQYLKTHYLEGLGVKLFLGSFAFFSDGDVLLRRGPDPRSTGDNIRAFQRLTNKQSIEPETPDSGLVRCDLNAKHCERFGEHGIDFKAAYGVFIDQKTDEVYVSDTTRHVLRKYSADGAPLAGPVGDFKFPNQLLMHGEKILLADTNHHEIRTIDPATASFGKVLEKYNVTPDLATAAGHIWPSHFARVGKEWWVNNMRTGMNQGEIYLFDDGWRIIRRLNLPDGADPIALVAVGDEVWISDWYGDKIRRFSNAGEELSDLESAGLDAILATANVERRKFELISYSGIALIVLVLGGLAVRGFAVEMTKEPEEASDGERHRDAQRPEAPLYLEPDAAAVRKMAMMLRLFFLMMGILAALGGYLVLISGKPGVGYAFIMPLSGLLAFVALTVWVNRSNFGTAIRVESGTITLRDYTGRESSCALHEVSYDHTAIATHDAIVFLGRPRTPIYSRKDLEDRLFPLLSEANKVSALEIQKILIKYRHPQGIMFALTLVGLAIYAVWVFTH